MPGEGATPAVSPTPRPSPTTCDGSSTAGRSRRGRSGRLGRLWRWCRRNPTLAATAAALLLTFLLGTPTLFVPLAPGPRRSRHAPRSSATAPSGPATGPSAPSISCSGPKTTTMLSEELRPYRKALIDAGMKESVALVRDLEGDPRAEIQRLDAYVALARVQHDGGDAAAAADTIAQGDRPGREPGCPRPLQPPRPRTPGGDPSSRVGRSCRTSRRAGRPPGGRPRSCGRSRRGRRHRTPMTRLTLTAMNHYNAGNEHWAEGPAVRSARGFPGRAAAIDDQAIAQGDRRPMTLDHRRPEPALSLPGPRPGASRRVAGGRPPGRVDLPGARPRPSRSVRVCLATLARRRKSSAFISTPPSDGARRSPFGSRPPDAPGDGRPARQAGLADGPDPGADRRGEFQPGGGLSRRTRRNTPPRSGDSTAEAHEICDKLSLVQPLSWNLRIVQPSPLYGLAEFQAEDGLRPDLERLSSRSERLWEGLLRRARPTRWSRANLVVVRRRLAEELADRGRPDDAGGLGPPFARDGPRRPRSALRARHSITPRTRDGWHSTRPSSMPDQLRERRRRFAADAIAMLRQAVADGFNDAGAPRRLAVRPDPLRSRLRERSWPTWSSRPIRSRRMTGAADQPRRRRRSRSLLSNSWSHHLFRGGRAASSFPAARHRRTAAARPLPSGRRRRPQVSA